MDDIWGAYILQHYFPDAVIYDVATVYQDRNKQDLVTNLENELLGYRKTLSFLQAGEDFQRILPANSQAFWRCYRSLYQDNNMPGVVQRHRESSGR